MASPWIQGTAIHAVFTRLTSYIFTDSLVIVQESETNNIKISLQQTILITFSCNEEMQGTMSSFFINFIVAKNSTVQQKT